MKLKSFALILVAGLSAAPAYSATYTVDQDHSAVSFKIKHLFSKVQGRFNKFEGVIEYEPGKPESWGAQGSIDAATIDTNNADRDKHLKAADFFDVEKYPKIEFKTTVVKEATQTGAKVEGLLTLHGVEKPVLLDVEIGGVGADPWGNTRAAFTATTKLKRSDYGIDWNQPLNAGGFLLGEEVEITLDIEAVQKK